MAETPGFRRALVMMTGTSLLVPVIGIATAPILAQALQVEGRGQVAAAIAPNSLLVSVATIGLPEALTYFLAKHPGQTRSALARASLFGSVLGALSLVVVVLLSDVLAGGDRQLSDLIVLATALAVPTLIVNLFRGAAMGRQMWRAVAVERLLNSLLRLFALGGLALVGALDVLSAILVVSIAPLVAGIAYGGLLRRPPRSQAGSPELVVTSPRLLSFGTKIWLGAVASMLTGRLSQLLVTPLSDVAQLGLLVVAITISDVPFIVATAVRDAIFGVNSAEQDAQRLTATSRIATLVGLIGSLVLGVTLPVWIGPIFGDGFQSATLPTWLLLAAAVANVPGLIAGAGLGAWGRPGLRSVAPTVALVSNLIGMVTLVPQFGATGAALAGLISGLLTSAFATVAAARVLETSVHSYFIPTMADIRLIGHEASRIVARIRRRPPGEDQARL